MATVFMMLAAGVVIWQVAGKQSNNVATRSPIPVPTTPMRLDGAPTLGAAEATAAMIVFSDFECTYCARFATEIMPHLIRRYVDSGKALVVFRHLPLPIHTRAIRAAESAECAARQGRFWVMHDSLFHQPARLGESELESHARASGLNVGAFSECMTGAAADRVTGDLAVARDLGLVATPSIIFGVKTSDGSIRATAVITGVRPVKEFEKALDQALAGARTP